jgi:hypothetical protein
MPPQRSGAEITPDFGSSQRLTFTRDLQNIRFTSEDDQYVLQPKLEQVLAQPAGLDEAPPRQSERVPEIERNGTGTSVEHSKQVPPPLVSVEGLRQQRLRDIEVKEWAEVPRTGTSPKSAPDGSSPSAATANGTAREETTVVEPMIAAVNPPTQDLQIRGAATRTESAGLLEVPKPAVENVENAGSPTLKPSVGAGTPARHRTTASGDMHSLHHMRRDSLNRNGSPRLAQPFGSPAATSPRCPGGWPSPGIAKLAPSTSLQYTTPHAAA